MNAMKKSIIFVALLLVFSSTLQASHAKNKYPSTKSGVTNAIRDCAKKVLIPANSDKTQNWKLAVDNDGEVDPIMMTRAVQTYSFYKSRIASCASKLNPTFECQNHPLGELCGWSPDSPTGVIMDTIIQKYFTGLKNRHWCITAGYTVVPLRGLTSFCGLPSSTWE
jgi:hypothetical protein